MCDIVFYRKNINTTFFTPRIAHEILKIKSDIVKMPLKQSSFDKKIRYCL